MLGNVSNPSLTPVSYLVLGLVARHGAATPYDLKGDVARSIGHFWSFPHSQLYAEPERLARAGLLEEHREAGGRRRRTYRMTASGRAALREWLRDPTPEPTQIRDLGLLKLFFADTLSADEVAELARAQEALHLERLDHYEAVDSRLAGRPEVAFAHATLRMGILCERAFVRFWSGVAAKPPAAPTRRRAARPVVSDGRTGKARTS